MRPHLVYVLLMAAGAAMLIGHRPYARAIHASQRTPPLWGRNKSLRTVQYLVVGLGVVFIVGGAYKLAGGR